MDQKVCVRISRLPGFDDGIALPEVTTPGSAGADIRANLPADTRHCGLVIPGFARRLVPTGFAMAIPQGYEGQIRSRSGLALKNGLAVLNSPGTVDSDYRGPVGVILVNLNEREFTVGHGDRIAQLVIAPVVGARLLEVEDLEETERGAGGFGSTGID